MLENRYKQNYNMAEGKSTLYHIYNKPSANKEHVYNRLYDRMKEHNGFDERFIAINGYFFHYAYKAIVAGELYLVYITPTRTFYIPL